MSDTFDNRQAQSFRRAQAQYDALLPPEETTDDEGNCRHSWKRAGERDGTVYLKCRNCGVEDEQ